MSLLELAAVELALASSGRHSLAAHSAHVYTSLPCRLLRIWALELKAPVAFAPMTNGLCCTFFPHGGVIATGYVSALNRWTAVPLMDTMQQVLPLVLITIVVQTKLLLTFPLHSLSLKL